MDGLDIAKTLIEGIILLASFITAVIYLKTTMRDTVRDVNKEEFKDVHDSIEDLKEDMNERFDDVNKRIDKSDLESCRNFLVHAMVDIEHGVVDDALVHRFWDELDHYHKEKQNSYIDTRVQALIDSGKLQQRLKQ